MSETSPYMTALPGPSADYRFVPANNDIVEEAEIYENIAFPKTTQNTIQQPEPVLTSSQQSNKTQENEFKKFNRVFIMIALALIMGWALAACGLGMTIQARNQLAQVQDEISKLSHELDVEQSERKLATHRQDDLVKIMNSAFLGVQQKLDSFSEKDDLMILRHDNLAESVNSTFRVFQENLDSFSEKDDLLTYRLDNLSNNVNLSTFDFQQKLDSVLQKDELLASQQNNTSTAMNSRFADFQQTIDTFSQRIGGVEKEFIRLAGSTTSQGRVEIMHYGVWGTVCDDVRDQDAGNLMCRLLGFNTATAMYGNAFYGPGSGQIWLDSLRCTGTETTLRDCSHNGWGNHDCTHSEDLSIRCSS